MGRLIDGDGFKEILQAKAEALRVGCPDNQYGLFLARACRMVDLMPTVDAEPVRHGHWVFHADTVGAFETTRTEYSAKCSVCGRKVPIRTLMGASWTHTEEDDTNIRKICMEEYPYCHCGAKMDGPAEVEHDER